MRYGRNEIFLSAVKVKAADSLLLPDTAPQAFVACLSTADLPAELPKGIRLWETPEQAKASGLDGRLWVVEVPPGAACFDGKSWRLQWPVPASAICNRRPYRLPITVPAAGGVVVRNSETPEVLLIYRRGHWDLPKGKCDPGESTEVCARREVSEELGISPETLCLRKPLGRTIHAYPLGGYYAVKPTVWFLMETIAPTFSPQAAEEIREVCWLPLEEALRQVRYPTLQALLHRVQKLAGLGLL